MLSFELLQILSAMAELLKLKSIYGTGSSELDLHAIPNPFCLVGSGKGRGKKGATTAIIVARAHRKLGIANTGWWRLEKVQFGQRR